MFRLNVALLALPWISLIALIAISSVRLWDGQVLLLNPLIASICILPIAGFVCSIIEWRKGRIKMASAGFVSSVAVYPVLWIVVTNPGFCSVFARATIRSHELGAVRTIDRSQSRQEAPMPINTDDREWFTHIRDDGGAHKLITCFEATDYERREMPHAALIIVEYQDRDNGLPTKSAMGILYKLEGEIERVVGPLGGMCMGHTYMGGKATYVTYSPSPMPEKIRFKPGLLKTAELPVERRVDPDWQVFAQHLQLRDLEKEFSRNHALHQRFEEQHDDPTIAREVDYASVFPIESQRTAFLKDIAKEGFTYKLEGLWTDDRGWSWVEYQKTTTLDRLVMAEQTGIVRSLSERHGGEFDGWACVVMTEADSTTR